ncbi:MAG: HlyD family type I secretion periplasmic adaptor subunit [Alphaproteobacteria bacterium]
MSSEQAKVLSFPFIAHRNDETEFLPAALEIVETPASPAGRAIAGTIIAFFLIALLWASFGTVDIIATASGKIMPTERTKTIQPFETGVVRSIRVRDGQQVKAGDVLIEIDPTINEAERDRLQKEVIVAKLDVARLKAMLSGKPDLTSEFIAPADAPQEQILLQQRLLANQAEEMHAKLNGIDRQIAQSEGNKTAVESTIGKLKQSIPLLKQRDEMRHELAEKGYGSKLDALAARQDLGEHENELKVQQGRLAEANGALAALKEQRRQIEAEYHRNNLHDLAEAEQKAAGLQEQLIQASQRSKLQTLVAPVDGTAQQLAVHTEGGVVTPAQALLSIVPADSGLEIEAMVSNRDIGFVQAGQEVAIKIDTFNFTKYGLLNGRVMSVSQDAIARQKPSDTTDRKSAGAESESSEPKGQELVYAARVSLDRTQMDVDGRLVNLSPGMAVTAEIKTGTRRIIEYLLSPLAKHGQEAMRER